MGTGKLAAYVHIDDRVYGPDDDVPQADARQITNPKAWAVLPEFEEPQTVDIKLNADVEGFQAGMRSADAAAKTLLDDSNSSDEPAADDGQPPAEEPGGVPVPPKGGAGSGLEAWQAYSASLGVDASSATKRDEVIAILVAAGKPVE